MTLRRQKRRFKRVQEMQPDSTGWFGRSRPVAQARQRLPARPRVAEKRRKLYGPAQRLPRGPGHHREHGHDLRPHAGAPRHDRLHDHPRAPGPGSSRAKRCGHGHRAARRRPAGGLRATLGRRCPAAQPQTGSRPRRNYARPSCTTPPTRFKPRWAAYPRTPRQPSQETTKHA